MIAQWPMDIAAPTPLLGGLSPRDFMRRHWQKKPLLVRAAWPAAAGLLERTELFALAARDDVESRLVQRHGTRWSLREGPFARRALPPLKTPAWTLLVQGVDLHLDAAHRLLERFRFVPDARLDDLMVSFASDGGGVGPHVDSYDVFLLQLRGQRRWRIGRTRKPVLRPDTPLKMLARFAPSAEWLLGPGDMLYLPPGWGHDGVAEGETLTASIGFRAAGAARLGAEVVQHLLDGFETPANEALYADPAQEATAEPARIPVALRRFAESSVRRLLDEPGALERALGEALSEPKPRVWFESAATATAASGAAVRLDRRTRMLYDDLHVYINGDAYRTAGADARLVRRLADRRALSGRDVGALSAPARALVAAWVEAGWLNRTHALPEEEPE
jgi:50S ribosomal protein L16 3-hydroxylase